jgi:hypothetical protein
MARLILIFSDARSVVRKSVREGWNMDTTPSLLGGGTLMRACIL